VGESGQRGVAAAASLKGAAAETEPPGRTGEGSSVASLIPRLFSDNLDARLQALDAIERAGESAAILLVETLLKTPPQSGRYPVLAEALERIGKPVVPLLLAGLGTVEIPRRADEVYLLEAVAEVLGHLADRRAVPALARMISLLRASSRRPADAFVASLSEAAKIRVHRALADLGSRDGADDLLELVGDGRKRVREEVIELAARVGDRRFLPALLRAHEKAVPVSEWHARHTRWAFREIARRDRVERGDDVFARLDAGEAALVEKLLPKAKGNGGHKPRSLRSA
jgi:HEAT repeat protein